MPQVLTAELVEAAEVREAELLLEAQYRPSESLAVYGSLAPGRANHHVVAPLEGTWTEGVVEGDRVEAGWGATLGYPAFRPRAGGEVIAVHVLTSDRLPAAWGRLDEFEGAEYCRILVPIFARDSAGERSVRTVANLYAVADDASSGNAA